MIVACYCGTRFESDDTMACCPVCGDPVSLGWATAARALEDKAAMEQDVAALLSDHGVVADADG